MATKDERSPSTLATRLADEPLLSFLPQVRAALPKSEWFLVGGAVRDHLVGRVRKKDYDLVVRNAALEKVRDALASLGRVDLVGRDFGVLRFIPEGFEHEEPVDIALPRTERAGGSGGYRDFDVQADPKLPLKDDLARRDFTMNAVAFDLATGELVDPFGGRADIEARMIRAVGDPAARFEEDLSRILRCVRLSCELGFAIDDATWDALAASAPRLNALRRKDDGGEEAIVPRETVAKNLVRALAFDPVKAVDLLEHSDILFALVPELAALARTPQSPDHHSEGDAWTHTKRAVMALRSPAFEEFFPGEKAATETVVATLLHDVGKPGTAEVRGDRITFYGHDRTGADIAMDIARRLRLSSVPGYDLDEERLSWLVHMHLMPNAVDLSVVKRTTLEKHFLRDATRGRALLHLAFADASASLRPDGRADLGNLRALVAELGTLEARGYGMGGATPPLLTGDEVMSEFGLDEGIRVGRLLAELREAQLRDEVRTPQQAKVFLRAMVATDEADKEKVGES